MQFKVAIDALKFIDFPPKSKILDIGCGDGRITKYIADHAPDSTLIGIDLTPSMLTVAQKHAGSRLSFQAADAAALPFDAEFDRIVSFNCLHWVPDILSALKGVNRALLPGGKALLLIAPTQARHPFHNTLEKVGAKDAWRPYFESPKILNHLSFATWAKLLEEAGLIPEQMQLVNGSIDYPDKAAFASWLAGWIPFGTIPEIKREAYLRDIVDTYTAIIPCEADGTLHFRLDELMMKALKYS